jgi:hypothetical protein
MTNDDPTRADAERHVNFIGMDLNAGHVGEGDIDATQPNSPPARNDTIDGDRCSIASGLVRRSRANGWTEGSGEAGPGHRTKGNRELEPFGCHDENSPSVATPGAEQTKRSL